jgi:ATP-dependent Clp endopeptidase proteolytic subunit ClpP
MQKPEDQNEDGHPYDNITLDALGVHQFFGEVDEEKAVSACEFILKSNIIQKNLSVLTMVLNTVGGECSEAFAIIDMMDTSRIPIATVGVGNIMSMGVLLLSAGAKGYRTMTKNTEVMAHQFAGYFGGKQHELIAVQDSFRLLEQKFIRHFTTHSRMSEKQVRDVLFAPSDRYLTPAECLRYGLVDRVTDYALAGLPSNRAIPRALKARAAKPKAKAPARAPK